MKRKRSGKGVRSCINACHINIDLTCSAEKARWKPMVETRVGILVNIEILPVGDGPLSK
jgi:hypothetical protein